MTHDLLWTPWRLAYVTDPAPRPDGCPFCLPEDPAADREVLVVHRGDRAYVILNRYPYNPGHVMIIPYRHESDYTALEDGERHEIADLTNLSIAVLRDVSAPHAFNVGFNLGAGAGAGIAEHLHCHVVPRWGADTNFMTVTGGTRVLPQMLDDTFERLAARFAGA